MEPVKNLHFQQSKDKFETEDSDDSLVACDEGIRVYARVGEFIKQKGTGVYSL